MRLYQPGEIHSLSGFFLIYAANFFILSHEQKEVLKYYHGDRELYVCGERMSLIEARAKYPHFKRFTNLDSFDCVAGCLLGEQSVRGVKIYPATRKVFYNVNGSKHKCDARCRNAKGHNCECSCGGANHGINC